MPDVAVASGRIVDRPANGFLLCQRQLSCLAVNIRFNLFFYLCLHLMALAVDNLYSIIIERIVACRDHDATVKILCPRHIRHARCGGHVEKICICS